jgi:hypothetical protein
VWLGEPPVGLPAATDRTVCQQGQEKEFTMGCRFALMAGVFPRLALVIVWVARPARVDAAFDTFLPPLLGIGHWGVSATQRNRLPGRRPAAA